MAVVAVVVVVVEGFGDPLANFVACSRGQHAKVGFRDATRKVELHRSVSEMQSDGVMVE